MTRAEQPLATYFTVHGRRSHCHRAPRAGEANGGPVRHGPVLAVACSGSLGGMALRRVLTHGIPKLFDVGVVDPPSDELLPDARDVVAAPSSYSRSDPRH